MYTVPVVCGPTASGKTSLAVSVFGKRGFHAISADSMQIYKYMPIGTAAPTRAEISQLPHHLVDFIDPDQAYSVGDFYRDACTAIRTSTDKNEKMMVVGGTGLYLKSLIHGFFSGPQRDQCLRDRFRDEEKGDPGILYRKLKQLDPIAAERLHPADEVRVIRALEVFTLTGESIVTLQERNTVKPEFRFKIAGIIRDRTELNQRIEKRIELMFERGLLDEVKGLRSRGYSRELTSMKGLGYTLCYDYLDGTIGFDTLKTEFVRETKAFARRQITLFKKLPGIVWFHGSDEAGLEKYFFAC